MVKELLKFCRANSLYQTDLLNELPELLLTGRMIPSLANFKAILEHLILSCADRTGMDLLMFDLLSCAVKEPPFGDYIEFLAEQVQLPREDTALLKQFCLAPLEELTDILYATHVRTLHELIITLLFINLIARRHSEELILLLQRKIEGKALAMRLGQVILAFARKENKQEYLKLLDKVMFKD